jgi:hypothetical protein
MTPRTLFAASLSGLLLVAPAAHAIELVEDEDHYVNITAFVQPRLSLAIDGDDNSVAQDMYIRRVRLLFDGKVHENVGFYIGTLTADIGRDANQSPATVLGDAWMEGDIDRAFKINAGLLKLPFSRHGAQGAGGLHGIDFHGAFLERNVGTPDKTGKLPVHRDLGVMFRGLVLDDVLDYRLAVVDGVAPNEHGDYPRVVGRLGVNLMDGEPDYFWKGTYLGKKSVVSFGFSFDIEPGVGGETGDDTFYAMAFDALVDVPFGPNGLVATVVGHQYGAGGAVPKGFGIWGDLGFRIKKIEPLVEVEYYEPSEEGNRRVGVFGGANYWIKGHQANVKLQVGAVDVETKKDWATEVLMQGQVMF